jgi:hypothetical protein
MASAPVTPTPASPITTISNDITWIRGHVIAVLLAVALIAGSIIGGIGLFESLVEKHDARVAASQLAKENVDTSKTATLVAALTQEHAEDAQRDAAQSARIDSLVALMAQQRAATAKQVNVDSSLTVNDAAARLAQQTKAGPGDVTVVNNAVTMSLPMTRTVVESLDNFAQAQSDVTNLSGQLEAQKILTTDAKVELQTSTQLVAADKVELISTIKADNSACIASTKIAVDDEAKKGRKRGFWIGLASFIGGIAVHAAI